MVFLEEGPQVQERMWRLEKKSTFIEPCQKPEPCVRLFRVPDSIWSLACLVKAGLVTSFLPKRRFPPIAHKECG